MTDLRRLTRRETAQLLGVTYRTVSNWLGDDDPPPMNKDNKTFSAPSVVKWYAARCIERSGKPGIESQEAIAWLEKFRRERYRLSKLERREREGALMPTEQIFEAWAQRVRAVAAGLEAFADRLTPLLVGKDRGAVAAIIKAEVRLLREAYARPAKFCPQTEVEVDADGSESEA